MFVTLNKWLRRDILLAGSSVLSFYNWNNHSKIKITKGMDISKEIMKITNDFVLELLFLPKRAEVYTLIIVSFLPY